MTMTDLAAKQSICISLALFWCRCTKYHEKVSVVIVPAGWNNGVIRQSAFDLGGQLIHPPIHLNYFLWNGYKRQTEQFILSPVTIPFFICWSALFFGDGDDAAFLCNDGAQSTNTQQVRQTQRKKSSHCVYMHSVRWYASQAYWKKMDKLP